MKSAPGDHDGGDRVAVVTGAATGIGRACAVVLARREHRVAITSRDPARAHAAASAIAEAAGRPTEAVVGLEYDAEAEGAADALITAAVARFGRLDVLVNNAGVGQVAPSEELAVADFRRVVEVDLVASFACARAAARVMLAAGRGVIVNVSSLVGHVGLAGRAAYSAAKHGLEGLTKTLATEWGPRGVRVVSVAPGYVATELLAGTMAAGGFTTADLEARTPLRRLAEPGEVARAVAFLASDDAAYVTGSSLLVDGGWVADGGWRTS